MSSIPPFISETLGELKRRLSERFGARLVDVRLFGSWARGEPRVGSDIDVLVLIAGLSLDEKREAIDLGTDAQLDRGTMVSLMVMRQEEFAFLLDREVGFALDVARDGISA